MRKAPIALFMFGWAAGFGGLLLWMVTEFWPVAPGIAQNAQPADERTGLALIICLGAIGGYVRWMHYLRVIVYDPDKTWQWVLDSLLTPLAGAMLALLFCIAFRAGLTQSGQSGGAGVNWMGLYALAGIAGLFSPDAIKRLEVMFQAMFASKAQNTRTDTEPTSRRS